MPLDVFCLFPDGAHFIIINPRRLGQDFVYSKHGPVNNQRTVPPQCTAPAVPCDICTHRVGGNSSSQHAPQPHAPSKASSGRPRPRARQIEHIGVCAVARGIHRSFRSAIRLRTEGARSAGVDTRPIPTRDARKACRLRATCRRLRATLGRRQGARELRAT